MVVPEDYWTALPAWSADGSLFLLGTRRGVVAFREHGRSGQPRSPINLGGPTHTYGILATPDVRKLLAYVVRDVSEVVRLDRARGALTPVFDDGTRALNLAYSPDGSRVAWVADDTERLWVSRSDGSERVPLSDARVFAAGPLTWSPDGSRIAFTALHGETGTAARHRLHLASPGDGTVEPLTEDDPGRYQLDPCWSPDGRWLVYGLDQRAPVTAAEFYLRRVDLETRRVTRLEGSEGLWNPRCSADGRILARDRVAGREHEETRGPSLTRRLAYKVRDPASGAWTAVDVELPAGATPPGGKLASGDLGYETWSRDGRQVYAYQSPQRRIVRFGAASGRLETVAQLTDLEAGSGWFSLDPGDVPLLLRSRPQQELVVMDLEVE
jgi:hypothetical protein